MEDMNKIIITSPSLNALENVSGISSVVKNIISADKENRFIHLKVGKTDRQKHGSAWALNQLKLLFRTFLLCATSNASLLHLNTPFNSRGIARDLIILLIAKIFRIKVVTHFHGGEYFSSPPKSRFFSALIRLMLRASDVVVVLSETEASILKSNYNADDNVTILPNSVNAPEHSVVKNVAPINIVYLGRIVPSKGTREIVSAISELSLERTDFTFTLCGVGEDVCVFDSGLKDKLEDRYSYKGIVDGLEKSNVLTSAHIFLLPSKYEGLPIALLEAMAYGAIPIVTPVGSIPAAVIDDFNGFLVPSNSSTALKQKINFVLDLILSGEGAKYSANAAKTIRLKFSQDTYNSRLTEIYSRVEF